MVSVLLHRPGSIIADYQFGATTSSPNSLEFANANKKVVSTLGDEGFLVDLNAFVQSGKGDQHLILKKKIKYNFQIFISMIISCRNAERTNKAIIQMRKKK